MSLSHAQVSSWPWVLSCFCTSYIRYGVFSRLRCLRAVFHHRLHFIAHPLYPRSSLVTMVIPPLLEKTRTLNPLLSTGVDKVVRTSVLAWLSVIRSWRLSNSCIIFSLITVWWKQQKSVQLMSKIQCKFMCKSVSYVAWTSTAVHKRILHLNLLTVLRSTLFFLLQCAISVTAKWILKTKNVVINHECSE